MFKWQSDVYINLKNQFKCDIIENMNKEFIPYLDNIERILSNALPLMISGKWVKDNFGSLENVTAEDFSPLVKPTKSLIQLGGKRWRPLMLVLCAQAYCQKNPTINIDVEQLAYSVTPLVEFVHTASLIHDDIEDSSDTRRGKPAAYITYGVDVAINAGSWLYFDATVCIDSLNVSAEIKNQLYKVWANELRRLHLGQAMDISWHRNKNVRPTVDQYLTMVRCKTGTLASLAAKIGMTIAGASEDECNRSGAIAADIGAGFQIIDDVINLTTGNPGKKRGDDIVERKKSLPVNLFFEKFSYSHIDKSAALLECFEKAHYEGIESSAVEQAIGILEEFDVINMAKEKGIELINTGLERLESLLGSGKYTDLLKNLFKGMVPSDA